MAKQESAERQRRRETGERLRYWRMRRQCSQAEVARAAGITQASLSNYETGKRELPMSTALAIVSALDSRLGRVVRTLMDRPDLLDSIAPRRVEAEAAS